MGAGHDMYNDARPDQTVSPLSLPSFSGIFQLVQVLAPGAFQAGTRSLLTQAGEAADG